MPSYTGAGTYCSKLVNDVTRDKVDIIISKSDGGVFHAFSSQLVKFCIIHPTYTLKYKTNGGVINTEYFTLQHYTLPFCNIQQ